MKPLVSFEYQGVRFSLLKHDSILVELSERNVYFDPFRLDGFELPQADAIFITHDHFDHFSPEDVKKLHKDGTVLIFPVAIEKKVQAGVSECLSVCEKIACEFYKKYSLLEQITFTTIPAYNVNKFRKPGEVYHPKELGYVGYVVNFAGTSVYVAGDTDFIEEMKALQGAIDIAFLPVSGTYVMTIEEAVQAALTIKPKVVVPMHYGDIVGDLEDGAKFAEQLKQAAPEINVFYYRE